MHAKEQLKINQGLVGLIAVVIGFMFMTGLTSVSADRYVGSATVDTTKKTIRVDDTVFKYDVPADEIARSVNPPSMYLVAVYTNDKNVVTHIEPTLDWGKITLLVILSVMAVLSMLLIAFS